jgi:hypothetical protein
VSPKFFIGGFCHGEATFRWVERPKVIRQALELARFVLVTQILGR